MIKKLREVRETNGLELDQEGAEPIIGRNFKTSLKFRVSRCPERMDFDSTPGHWEASDQ